VNRDTTGVNSLPKTVTRQRHDCDLNQGPTAPQSSTLTVRLPSHLITACLTYLLEFYQSDSCRSRAMTLLPLHLVVNWYVFTRATQASAGTRYGPVSVSVSVCLSVCLSVTSRVLSKGMNGLIWFLARALLSTSPTLCFKEIQVSTKIRVGLLPSGTFLVNSGLRNFATTHRSSNVLST